MFRLIVIGAELAIINAFGDIMVIAKNGENGAELREMFCTRYDYTMDEIEEQNLIITDWTNVYYDREHDKYITFDMLYEEFYFTPDIYDRWGYNGFENWFKEVTGKNGTLEIIERKKW